MIEAIDLGVMHWLDARRGDALTAFVRALTNLGDTPVLIAAGVIGTALLVLLRQPRPALVFALTALGSWGVSEGSKALVDRPRPGVVAHLVPLPGNASFPSGHALCSMAIYGCLGLILGRLVPRPVGWLPPAVGVLLGLAIGLTRPYLGVHYPSDVVAGWMAGLGCALLGAALAWPAEAPPAP